MAGDRLAGAAKPVQAGGPPIIVGGKGTTRTPALAARYASEFNMPFTDLDTFRAQCRNVATACESTGRDPAELRENGAAGTPDEVIDTLRAWSAAGAQRIYLQVLDLADLADLDLVAETVAPHLA